MLSKQNIVSRNINTYTLNTMDYYRNSLSNVSQGKVKVLNQFKQSKLNKPKMNKDTSKQIVVKYKKNVRNMLVIKKIINSY